MDGTDSPAFRAWKCGLFDLFLLAKTIVGIDGAVSLALDGAAIQSESSPLDQARYSWEDDTLELSFYAEDVTFSARVEHPVSGENLVASGALYPGDDCYYDVKAGVVTLDGFTGAEVDRWLTGTFDVQFTKSSFAEGTCPDHQAVGRFGAAVCR
jgi:hypothetical protein